MDDRTKVRAAAERLRTVNTGPGWKAIEALYPDAAQRGGDDAVLEAAADDSRTLADAWLSEHPADGPTLRDEVTAVLGQLDDLANVWGDEGVFRRCRDRLRAALGLA